MTTTSPNLDDRMALAIALINEHLAAAGKSQLTPIEHQVLRTPAAYREHVNFLRIYACADLRAALALLDEWHAWHGGH